MYLANDPMNLGELSFRRAIPDYLRALLILSPVIYMVYGTYVAEKCEKRSTSLKIKKINWIFLQNLIKCRISYVRTCSDFTPTAT